MSTQKRCGRKQGIILQFPWSRDQSGMNQVRWLHHHAFRVAVQSNIKQANSNEFDNRELRVVPVSFDLTKDRNRPDFSQDAGKVIFDRGTQSWIAIQMEQTIFPT